ncbi:phage major capsid protein, partial [Streptococcus suis]
MFDEKIKELKATIAGLSSTIATKTTEVKAALEADDLETAKSLKAEIETAKANHATAEETLAMFEEALATGGAENKEGVEMTTEEVTYREKVNAFIRSKGAVAQEGLRMEGKDEALIPMNAVTPVNPSTDGVKKADVKPVSSEEILYTPAREIKTVVDLKQFTTIHQAKKATGKYPVLQRATEKLISVEELEK